MSQLPLKKPKKCAKNKLKHSLKDKINFINNVGVQTQLQLDKTEARWGGGGIHSRLVPGDHEEESGKKEQEPGSQACFLPPSVGIRSDRCRI